VHAHREARERPELSALELQTEYHEKTRGSSSRRADDTSTLLLNEWGSAGCAPRRRARTAGPQGRLGHEARDDRALRCQHDLPWDRRGSRCSTSPTTT
jgi:hypothetical protein